MFNPEFWVAVAFVVVVVLGYRYLAPPIAGVLDQRGREIRAELEEARRLREDAQALLAKHQRQLHRGEKEAEGIAAHARTEAERHAREARAEMETQMKRRTELALERIRQEEEQAVREVRTRAVDLSIAVTRKLMADHLDRERQDALIESSLSEIRDRLH
jgi:F-type H+-transporting ATPase subunit b